ncbi:cytochrome P450 [Novosphingobium sp. MW5]|nr:cytochrome P450 [Novosphingobium sp. MW5]
MLIEKDFFTDPEILVDPYAYFEEVRRHGPVFQPPGKDYVIVTGFNEALDVFLNAKDFSSSIALQGAAAPLPFEPEGSDISEQLERNRTGILGHDLLVNLDDKAHVNLRSLVNRLFTPSRLKANEKFIESYSDELVRAAAAKGKCELIGDIATPFVTVVIADLLGVPVEDRQFFMDVIAAAPVPGSLDADENDYSGENHPMVVMGNYFAKYIRERQLNPRNDILSELAHASYPDGTTPNLEDLVNLSTFMFGAGQDTSAKLIGNAMRFIVDEPGLQDRLRQDPSLIAPMLEEVLRLEGSSKITARLAVRDTTIGGVSIAAGTKVAIALAVISRDPARWDEPNKFTLGRPRIKEHLSFGRGAHTCAGAPLARVEVRVLLEKFFEYTSKIDLDPLRHGEPAARRLTFEPSFIVRGLAELQLVLEPASAS